MNRSTTSTLAVQASRLHGRVIPRSALTTQLEDAMFALLASHFTGVDRRVFQADLAEKSSVILLEDDEGLVHGFSTMLVYDTMAPGRPVTVVYSGDTIMDRECWGSPALARTWIHAVRHMAQTDRHEVYWLLLTSGYRTYRFLPVFFKTFYPRCDEETPAAEHAVLDAIAGERFASHYDAAAGVVRLAHPYVLAEDLVSVPSGRIADANIAFFLSRNPGFVAGDELVCLTRVGDDNLTPAGRRMAGIQRS
ncbi:MAG TPA: hypothetical protein VI485_25275 [Vicinamibacterales bacterium]|nr:hypothetical protein [Vicinamibacterales bacterium]